MTNAGEHDRPELMRYLGLVLFTLTAGCSTARVFPVNGAALSPKPDDCEITLYTDADKIGRPFDEICLIEVNASGDSTDAVELGQEKACECGADGVIVKNILSTGDGWQTNKRGNAVLRGIRFK